MSVGEVECGCHFLSFSSGSSTRSEIALRVSALVHARGNSPASVNSICCHEDVPADGTGLPFIKLGSDDYGTIVGFFDNTRMSVRKFKVPLRELEVNT